MLMVMTNWSPRPAPKLPGCAARKNLRPFVESIWPRSLSLQMATKRDGQTHGRHHMRKLTAGLFYSVDGVAEAPNEFQFDSFDDELGQLLGSVMADVDTVLMGRQGYQEWAGY